MRLDAALVEKKIISSRNRAQQAIKEGNVTVDGIIVKKCALEISEQKIALLQAEHYVSRAAYKLDAFLKSLNLDIASVDALDIGSSTGGFVQVLLENGVAKVVAVDVGKMQLHATLRDDKRVELHENQDIRTFEYSSAFYVVSCDVSFISLAKILQDIDRLSSKWIILLFKPQFEVGRNCKRDKNGVVTDQNAINLAMDVFEQTCKGRGWELVKKEKAIIKGKDGNTEYCYCYRK